MSNYAKPKQKRGAVSKDTAAVVTVWVPRELLAAIDTEVARQDSDRSKFVRSAIRRALAR